MRLHLRRLRRRFVLGKRDSRAALAATTLRVELLRKCLDQAVPRPVSSVADLLVRVASRGFNLPRACSCEAGQALSSA